MGWNTFAENNLKPYGKGRNTVFTRHHEKVNGIEVARDAVQFLENLKEDTWLIGGGQIFTEALPYATHLYITRIEGDFECDVFFPEFEEYFVLIHAEPARTENGKKFTYQIWEPKKLL